MSHSVSSLTSHRRGAAFIVAAAAALWGLDAYFRIPFAVEISASSLVFGEHVILVIATLPWLLGAIRAARKLDLRSWIYLIFIGAGASAGATVLFTKAFATGDAITPLMLQKFQPFVVVLGAGILLRERIHPRYAFYLVAAIAGAWLIAFAQPFDVAAPTLKPALYSIAAATLWAMGTVLGRHLSVHLEFKELTTLRFLIGLPAAFVIVLFDGAAIVPASENIVRLVFLSLIVGLLAMLLYYYGLRRTPAVVATIAELTFPVVAAIVGYLKFDAKLDGSQWLGVIVLSATVLLLSWQSNRHEEQIVDIPEDTIKVSV